jgi:hypothetical protein
MAGNDSPRRNNFDTDGGYGRTWLAAYFLIFLALRDSFLFRNLLTPEFLETEIGITEQGVCCFFGQRWWLHHSHSFMR